jgi:hypothetical protein
LFEKKLGVKNNSHNGEINEDLPSSLHNEDSMSSNCSSNNSFSSTLSNVSNIYMRNSIDNNNNNTTDLTQNQIQQRSSYKIKPRKTVFERLSHKNMLNKHMPSNIADSNENNNFYNEKNSHNLEENTNLIMKAIKSEGRDHVENNHENSFFNKYSQHAAAAAVAAMSNKNNNINMESNYYANQISDHHHHHHNLGT